MDKHELAVQRGEEADRMLNSDMFDRAFGDTRKAILETWAGLPVADKENAQDLHRMVKVLDRVRKCIEEHVRTGQLAQKEIEGKTRGLFSIRR